MPKHEVNTYESLKSLLTELENNQSNKIYILFTATKDDNAVCPLIKKTDSTGKTSWCSDCNQSFPLLEECSEKIVAGNENLHFITCYVGDRDSWKNQSNSYRTELNIQSVPTLQNWQTKSKISEAECLDKAAINSILN